MIYYKITNFQSKPPFPLPASKLSCCGISMPGLPLLSSILFHSCSSSPERHQWEFAKPTDWPPVHLPQVPQGFHHLTNPPQNPHHWMDNDQSLHLTLFAIIKFNLGFDYEYMMVYIHEGTKECTN